ncbi:MAG: O-succinylbenzoic acid--CoA ligase [Bacteroidetes bacterium HGW-Bacteroidetes-17]|jgi:O-succinylbenzoic acid--CoA ligase|nr:MAG: O-succinylbenzoic acid--CoA ligase [Bacteroidetes bacterium HGW-Bacteroidetes-17]
MSHKKYDKLILDGQILHGDELQKYCVSKLKQLHLKDWEKHLFGFVLEWLDEEEEIKVKTSGSTGIPKTILLKKQYMINSAMATAVALKLETGQTALLALSSEYIAGKMMVVRAMVIGLNLIAVEPTGNPLENLKKEIDFTALVPLQLSNILNSLNSLIQLKKIKKVLIGGGALDQNLVKETARFSNDFYASYGMTETCTHIALRKLNGKNQDLHFTTLPGVKISTDHRSCLVIDAPHLSDNPLISNDLVTLYSNSEFLIKGRFDCVINSGGIKISPEEVEDKLSKIIKENFLITSIPDQKFGEKIILLIESDQSNLNALYELWSQIESILSPYEVPKQIDFIKPFSYTATGKIDRLSMKELIRKKLKNN